MKRIKYLLLLFLLLLTMNVNAKNESLCEQTEFKRVRELAKKVEFDYEYELVDGKAVFTINAMNLNKELKVQIIDNEYSDDNREFKNAGNNRGSLKNFKEGERVVVTITAFVPNWCSGEKVYTKVVKLPYYNYYYDEEKCKGYEEYRYCKQLIDSNITQEKFEKGLESFIAKKNKENEKPQEEEDNKLSYIIIGAVSLVVAIGAAVLIIHNVKRIKEKNTL